MDLTLPVRVTFCPWWCGSGRSMDSELVCKLVILWQLSVSLLPADELLRFGGQGLALEGRERPDAGLDAGESVHRSGVLPYSGLLPPLCPPMLPRLPVPEEGESRLACRASVPWGLPSADGHLPESGVPGELGLLLALLPNNLGKVIRQSCTLLHRIELISQTVYTWKNVNVTSQFHSGACIISLARFYSNIISGGSAYGYLCKAPAITVNSLRWCKQIQLYTSASQSRGAQHADMFLNGHA